MLPSTSGRKSSSSRGTGSSTTPKYQIFTPTIERQHQQRDHHQVQQQYLCQLTRACVDITPAAAEAAMAANCQLAYVLYGLLTESGKPRGSTSASIACTLRKTLVFSRAQSRREKGGECSGRILSLSSDDNFYFHDTVQRNPSLPGINPETRSTLSGTPCFRVEGNSAQVGGVGWKYHNIVRYKKQRRSIITDSKTSCRAEGSD